MSAAFPADLLASFGEFIAERMALHFPPSRSGDLETMALSASKEMGYADPESFMAGLLSSPLSIERMEILACHLTVGESYFWREPQAFEALEGRILPSLIRSREGGERRLRIWCAGCSTGEEAYSIAIALRRAIPAIGDWKVRIIATDINSRALKKARAGIYGEWSFRNAPPWLVEGFFRLMKDGKREISPELRAMVSFEYLNLAEDRYPSALNDTNAMDLIFCRNVLMYFSPERALRIVESLRRSLVEGGWLIPSACECSQVLFSEFEAVQFAGAGGYRKAPAAPREPPGSAVSPIPAAPRRLAPKPAKASQPRTAPRPLSALRREASPLAAPTIRELADQGRLSEALASCDAAISADRIDPRLHRMRATILQELNREEEAMAALKTSIYLDPESVSAYFTLGNLAQRGGNFRTGRRSFKNALALLGDSPDGEVLPETEGLTAGRLREIIRANMRIDASITEAV